MQLNKSNYFSLQAGKEFMSVSQFKSLVHAYGGCEYAGVSAINGLYEQPKKIVFLEGSYVHSFNEGPQALEEFKYNNPDMYASTGKNKGQLKANFQHCNKMIEVLENDPYVMAALSGKKEVILTAELFGIKWKCMIDSHQPDMGIFADLKALKEMDGKFWNKDAKAYENFLEHYGYILQMAVYAEIERIANKRDKWLVPHIIVVTKQDPPDHEVLYFDDEAIQQNLNIVENHIERVKLVKSGQVEPERCGSCAYCRSTKRITKSKHYRELDLY